MSKPASTRLQLVAGDSAAGQSRKCRELTRALDKNVEGEGTNLGTDHESKQIIVDCKVETNSLLQRLLLLLQRSLQVAPKRANTVSGLRQLTYNMATSRVQAAGTGEGGGRCAFKREHP